jgi:hypothetical protein
MQTWTLPPLWIRGYVEILSCSAFVTNTPSLSSAVMRQVHVYNTKLLVTEIQHVRFLSYSFYKI